MQYLFGIAWDLIPTMDRIYGYNLQITNGFIA